VHFIFHSLSLCGLNSSGCGEGPVVGPCEHSTEPLGSIKAREFLDGHSYY
jgi:hypothetical protein